MRHTPRFVRSALLVIGLASPGIAAEPQVRTVPWVASDPSIPHDTFASKSITLKATSSVSGPQIRATWDFGDGSAPASFTVTNPYDVSTRHAYYGAPGTVFSAKLTISDTSTGESGAAAYLVAMRDRSLDTEVNVAIDEGLWYLHKTMNRVRIGDEAAGTWQGDCGPACDSAGLANAANILAFERKGHLESGDPSNPYTETVARGMKTLFHQLLNADRAPESDWIEAIVASGTPRALAVTGPATVLGQTYRDVLQQLADGRNQDARAAHALGNFGITVATRAAVRGRVNAASPTAAPGLLLQLALEGIGRPDRRWVESETRLRNHNSLDLETASLLDLSEAMQAHAPALRYLHSTNDGTGDLDWYSAEAARGDAADGVARTLVNRQDASGFWKGHSPEESGAMETAQAIRALNVTPRLAVATVTNVTGQLSIVTSGPGVVQLVTATNTGASTIAGPLSLGIAALKCGFSPCEPGTVTLVNQSGTFNGDPFVVLNQTGLNPGQSVSVLLQFAVSSRRVGFSYTPLVYAGTLPGSSLAVFCPAVTAVVNTPYNSFLVATGGVLSYTYSTIGSLPQGLLLNPATGAITGSPTTPGNVPFTGKVVDSSGGTPQTATANCSINVAANVKPTALPFPVFLLEDSAPTPIALAGTDTETPPANLTFTITQAPTSGVLKQGATVLTAGSVLIGGSPANVTYQPNADANGADNFKYKVTDRGAPDNCSPGPGCAPPQDSDEAIMVITITPVNDVPGFTLPASPNQDVVNTSGAQTIPNFAINRSAGPANESSQTLTFLVTNDTNGLFTVQPAISPTGTLTYTPNPAGNGTATVTVRVMDNGGTANGGVDTSLPQTFTIRVHPPNQPPLATPQSGLTVLEDNSLPITLSGTDADGNSLTFAIVTGPTNGTLGSIGPPVCAGNPSTCTAPVTYTPNANYFGPDSFTFKVNDGIADSPAATVSITVNPVNDAPSFTAGPTQTVLEDSGAQTVAGWATAISDGPNETGQTLTFNTINNSNPSLFSAAPTVAPNGTLTYTLAANAFGTATITLTLSDNGGTANGGVDTSAPQTFVINVTNVNDAPSFTKGPDVTVLEDPGPQTVSPWATALNPGPNESGQTLTFNVTGNTNAALFSAGPAISSAGTLTFTPAANANGSATITVTLSDNGGTANGGSDTSPSQTFTINVTAVNDAPAFTRGPDQSVLQNSGAQTVLNWATAISPGPADESAQTVTFNIINNSNPALFSAGPAIASNGTLTYTPATNVSGNATISVTLSDSGGTANGGNNTSAIQTFLIVVNFVNNPPSFTKGPDVTVLEDAGPQSAGPWATAISPGPNLGDVGQTVTFQITGNSNPGLFSAGPAVASNGTLTFTTAANANGSATIALVAKDNGGTANVGNDTSASQTFNINVTAVNDAPTFTKGPDQTVNEDSGFQTVPNWATNVIVGPPDESAQTFGFGVSNNTNPGLFSAGPAIANDGTLTYTPAPNAFGSATITVLLTDSGGTANGGINSSSQTFVITVNGINDPPVFTRGPDQTVSEDGTTDAPPGASRTVNGWATAISAGPNEGGQVLNFIVSNDNNALFSVQPAISPAGNLTYTLAANRNGSTTVTVQIHDNGGTANGGIDTSAPQTFTINVTPVNDPPVLTAKAYNVQANMQIVVPAASGLLVGTTDPNNPENVSPTFTLTALSVPANSGAVGFAADGSFSYDPQPGGTSNVTFTYTVCDNGIGVPASSCTTSTGTFVLATPVIWFVNPGAGPAGAGTLASPFNMLGAATTAASGNTNNRIFVYTGTANATGNVLLTGAGTQAAAQWLVGQGVTGANFDTVMGVSPPPTTIPRPLINGTNPTIQGTVTIGPANSSNNVIRGVTIQPSSGSIGLNAFSSGTGFVVGAASFPAVASDVSISTTNAAAVSLGGGGSGSFIFKSISANGGTNGIVLNNFNASTGSFTVTGDGSTASSGGTITESTQSASDADTAGKAVYLNSTSNVTLKFVKVSVTTANASGILATNLGGTNLLEKCDIDFNNAAIDPIPSANAMGLSVTNTNVNTSITLDGTIVHRKLDGFSATNYSMRGSSSLTLNVQDSNTGDGFESKYTGLFGSGIVVGCGDTTGSNGVCTVNVSNTKFIAPASNGINDLEMTVQQDNRLNFNVNHNTFDMNSNGANALVGMINVNATGNGQIGSAGNPAIIDTNTIQNLGSSGALPGYQAIRIAPDNCNISGGPPCVNSPVTHRVHVQNNIIQNVWQTALNISGRAKAILNIDLLNNTIGTLANPVGKSNRRGVLIETQGDSSVITTIDGNTIVNAGTSNSNSGLAIRGGTDSGEGSVSNLQATVNNNVIKNSASAGTGGWFRAETISLSPSVTSPTLCLNLTNNILKNSSDVADSTKEFNMINANGTFNRHVSGNTGTVTETGSFGSVGACTVPSF